MKNVAVIFAGGSGRRMNTVAKPKQFLELNGKPIIVYTIELFDNLPQIDGIVVVCIEDWIPYMHKLIKKFELSKVVEVVPGGETGQDSIYNGLACAAKHFPEESTVLIHDGVRPLINEQTILKCVETTAEHGTCITCIPATETFVVKREDDSFEIPTRANSLIARAPQCFKLKDILDAHHKAQAEGRHDFIDSCTMMSYYGHKLTTIIGPMENIKITTPTDFFVFRAMVEVHEINKSLVSKMNSILIKDIQEFKESFALAEELQNSVFLITGSTGLLGSMLIHCLISIEKNIKIIAPVRNIAKAESIFTEEEKPFIRFIECDISRYDYADIDSVNYIIHCAAPTSSKFFVEKPVDTFEVILNATEQLLQYAVKKHIKSFVYLSSLEVYGTIESDDKIITEDKQGYLDPLSVRSSYPMAKRAAENLCFLYAKQYGIGAKIARLTQTTGSNLAKDDNRVIVQFARLAANGEDIILHTKGDSARSYCYTVDGISAILYILLRGSVGEAYNVANPDTYISARDMAIYLKENFNNDIEVRTELNDNMGYAPATKLNLSTEKLQSLGWKANYGLKEIFERLMMVLKS